LQRIERIEIEGGGWSLRLKLKAADQSPVITQFDAHFGDSIPSQTCSGALHKPIVGQVGAGVPQMYAGVSDPLPASSRGYAGVRANGARPGLALEPGLCPAMPSWRLGRPCCLGFPPWSGGSAAKTRCRGGPAAPEESGNRGLAPVYAVYAPVYGLAPVYVAPVYGPRFTRFTGPGLRAGLHGPGCRRSSSFKGSSSYGYPVVIAD